MEEVPVRSPAPQPMQLKQRYVVSVVITTKNRATMVGQAIESVLAVKDRRNPKFDIELIVVDDGSTDETQSVVRKYPIRSFRTSGIGMAGARNLGLRNATGDFFTLLDDDDTWLPNNIAPQIALFEQHPELGAVHGRFELASPELEALGIIGPELPQGLSWNYMGWIFEELLSYFPQVATILTRMDAARKAGDFDPSLTGDNDWDWLLRIAKHYPIGRVPDTVMLFRQRASAHEQLAWRRFPATGIIFKRHMRGLSPIKQLQLRPILWRHNGWWATACFLGNARSNLDNGNRMRALQSIYFACRASMVHTVIHLPEIIRFF